jgi:hypothetical protein
LTPADVDYASMQPNGEDLRLVDADGVTVLAHEIGSWNPGGVSTVWVRIPQIDANSGTDHIWLYYGNPIALDVQTAATVWSGYAAVWHFDGDDNDSTANGNHGTSFGATQVAGAIGEARYFDGSSYIDAGSDASLGITGAITIEAWAQFDPAASGAPRIVSKKAGWRAPAGYNLEYKPATNTLSTLGSGRDAGVASGVALGTTWHYLVATINGSTATLYADGVDVTTDTVVSALAANTQALTIGRGSGGQGPLIGLVDEVRLAPVARSAAWIAAQYRAMNSSYVTISTLP